MRKTCESVDCGKKFLVKAPQQRFCSERCRSREHKRKLYETRKSEGLCPQCGNEMNVSKKRSYCDDCKEYFSENYIRRK